MSSGPDKGYHAGPPLIGLVAEGLGLTVGLAVLGALCGLIALGARALAGQPAEAARMRT